ncbi:MAG: family phosphatase [Actinotalea sp.]|nr:family phosphatase [Actinotalea sp.]
MGLSAPRPAGPPAADAAELGRHLRAAGAGLLLDLDGTLVDSEPVHRAAFVEYFASRGWQVDDEVLPAFTGRRAPEVFAALDGPWRGEDPHAVTDAVIDVLRASDERPEPVPGAVELLLACAATALPVAVVTSAHRSWADGAFDDLERLGAPRPRAVVAEDCVQGKPHAEPYRRGAELLGLDPAGLLAAEDAPAGLASARAAGVGYVLAVTTSHAAATLGGADGTAPDLWPLVVAVRTRPTVSG